MANRTTPVARRPDGAARFALRECLRTSASGVGRLWQHGSMSPTAASSAERQLDELSFSGVALVQHGDERIVEVASGLADRANGRPNGVDTRFATASVTKGFTAVTVASMIEDGLLALDTPLREVTGEALPDVDPGVTIEHLLGHTSGVGDYLDEEQLGDIDDMPLDVPAHVLDGPEAYLPLHNALQQVSRPGERFAYNNGGYVMLALAVEHAGGGSYHDEVRQRVFERAGMTSTDFERSDRLPADTALGYLADGRTNVFHLPVIGTGDGGAYTTAPDMIRFWQALLAGAIVPVDVVDAMTTPRHEGPGGDHYGLGFWVAADGSSVFLEGMDAGVSMRTGIHRSSGRAFCAVANNSADAWPIARIIEPLVAD